MSKLLLSLTCLTCLALPFTATAGPVEKTVRIEIQGTTSKPVELDIVGVTNGGKATYAEWAPADRKKLVIAEFPATNRWQEASITVRPLKTGRLGIVLAGPYVPEFEGTKQLRPIIAQYDHLQISSEGNSTLLENGSFEKLNGKGEPYHWILTDTPNSNPPVDDSTRAKIVGGDAADGDKFARAWHNSRCWQGISVEEGVPVTLTFSYRLEK